MIKPKILQWTAMAAAGVLLGGALVYYNFIDKAVKATGEDIKIKTFRVEEDTFSLDGESFMLSEKEGKVLVLNFWDTYCEPCQKEMHEFNEIQVNYAGQVEIYAIAGSASKKKVLTNWLTEKKWNKKDPDHDWAEFALTFGYLSAKDSEKLGVTGTLPHTMIVDSTGEIVFNNKGSMSYEALENEILKVFAAEAEREEQEQEKEEGK